jgi:iron-only hydrogenase group A
MRIFECRACLYKVKRNSLNDNFRCPICGASKEDMVLIENKYKDIKYIPLNHKNPGVVRVLSKCLNCGKCSDICKNYVGINYDKSKTKFKVCVHCGQCIINCPSGALIPRYNYKKVMDIINKKDKIVIVSTSPAVRVAIGEEFGLKAGEFCEGKMVAALKKLGFNYVFDTSFGADFTVIEETCEFLDRIKKNENLPQFTSCCPSWVKYIEMYHPNLIKHLSTTKSPIAIQSTIIKEYFSKLINVKKEDIITVALTPCTAKKYEINRSELKGLTDFVITTSELALCLKENNIDFSSLNDEKYDSILGTSSGGGLIFGNSGGVTESILRALYKIICKDELPNDFLHIKQIRGQKGVKEVEAVINGKNFKALVCQGLKNIEPFLVKLENNEKLKYDIIEVMNCPGGCIGGGGQPLSNISKLNEIRDKRIESLYNAEENKNIRCSVDNKEVLNIYNEFLDLPMSEKSHKYLHTSFKDKSKLLNNK